ncbi:MAG: fumarylacetoacetate hydrolase family protein [Bifidobacteriaceae bacterium]|nr:fumarylacetoacetate hydrolase family protein [Bifidobacteriaceae bacterium]
MSVRPPAAWAQPAPAQASPAQASRAEPAPALHLFMAPNTAVVGPGDPIVLPTWTREAVEEAELAIVIGRLAKDVPADRADEVIFGYTIANDVTARDVQRAEPQWARAKGFDTAVPLGPWIETDLPAGDTPVRAWVNGELRQDGSTLDLIHPIPALVAQISAAFTLLPGDVIMTGTPAGASRIEAGDTVACEAAGIGTLTNPVVRR